MENAKQLAQAQLGSSRQRTLTVSSLHRQWGAAHRKNECCVPGIRLNGKWLAALGLASGYEWTCPRCGDFQREIEAKSKVTCRKCNTEFATEPPEHAYEH